MNDIIPKPPAVVAIEAASMPLKQLPFSNLILYLKKCIKNSMIIGGAIHQNFTNESNEFLHRIAKQVTNSIACRTGKKSSVTAKQAVMMSTKTSVPKTSCPMIAKKLPRAKRKTEKYFEKINSLNLSSRGFSFAAYSLTIIILAELS